MAAMGFTSEGQRWRMLALGAAIFAIVLLPYLIAARATDSAFVSSDWVAHTAEVKATAYELIYLVRDVEAAALGLASDVEATQQRERVLQGLAAIGTVIERLGQLTVDNPAQQNRVGQIASRTQGRERLTHAALDALDAGDAAGARALLGRASEDFPVRDVARELVAEEEALLAQRAAAAERQRRFAQWLTGGGVLAQLVLLGVVTYLSERQVAQRLAAERESRAAVRRSEAVFQTVREPIALLDREQRVMMSNIAFCELYGLDPDVVLPPLSEVGGGVWSDPALRQRLSDVLHRDRELWDYETRQRIADGSERIVMINARRMPLPDRADDSVLMTVSDVTARKRSEDEIRELNRQLEGKIEQLSDVNRELESFSYSVSHDLRAPLRHIAGFADKLDRHLGREDEKTAHYLDVIGASAKRMAGLIDDLLIYSRLGRHAMRLQAVDMQSLVAEVREVLMSEHEGRAIDWRVQPLPIVIADENMMRQVWQNLLGNALKYSATRERSVIEVGMRRDGGMLEFHVSDNGVGFDMAYAGKLFGVFQRLHKPSDFPGSGIGLANVRRIVARHGGRIRAEAEPDRGASFYFTLPVQPDAPTT